MIFICQWLLMWVNFIFRIYIWFKNNALSMRKNKCILLFYKIIFFKVETDILPLMSALLLLVMLLPMLPAALGPYLSEIFEVFGRLASYYHHHQSLLSPSTPFTSTTIPNVIDKDHLYLIHLQVNICDHFMCHNVNINYLLYHWL